MITGLFDLFAGKDIFLPPLNDLLNEMNKCFGKLLSSEVTCVQPDLPQNVHILKI